nr:carboxypeptidase-like regulatory domain-containing protein [uncultured Carboxylicivirga sp.]
MRLSIKKQLFIWIIIVLPFFGLEAQVADFHYKNISLAALIDSISEQTNVKISYNAGVVPVDSIVDINDSQIHPYDLLKKLLKNKPLQILLNHNQIVIREKIEKISTAYLRFKGVVVDQDDGTPMAMVNIAVKNKALGTISNINGEFEFVIPSEYTNDSIVFSFIGYNNRLFSIAKVDSFFTVSMKSRDIKLKEVEIRYESVDDIIEKIKQHKSDNYFEEQTFLTGFYRESIKQDNKFVQVSEAIIEIQKPSYNNLLAFERVRFVKGRKLSGEKFMESINFKLEGGPYLFSRIDIARYSDFLPTKEDNKYEYSFKGIDYLNDEMVYQLGFAPVEDDGELKYKGLIWVDAQSYAIIHVDFELTKKSLKHSRKALIKKISRKIKANPHQAKYYIDYRKLNNKWIVNKVGGEIAIHINDKNQKINSEFVGLSELLISDCETDKRQHIKSSELYKPNYVLADEINETDEEFWENYNIIKPDEELEKVFKNTKVKEKVK